MKKTARILLCMVLVISLCATLVACGGSDDITGRYVVSSMEMDGTKIEGELLNSALALMGLSTNDMYIQLNADGTGFISALGQTANMEYADGQIWPVDAPDEKVAFEVDGDNLILTVEGYTMIFTK